MDNIEVSNESYVERWAREQAEKQKAVEMSVSPEEIREVKNGKTKGRKGQSKEKTAN